MCSDPPQGYRARRGPRAHRRARTNSRAPERIQEERSMVERRRLTRLKALAQKGGVVVQLRNGKTEVFSEHVPLYLWAADVEEGMEAEVGNLAPSEPTTPHGWEA